MICMICGREFDDHVMTRIYTGGRNPQYECPECNRQGSMKCEGRKREVVAKMKKRAHRQK